jgi:hypothetical protein
MSIFSFSLAAGEKRLGFRNFFASICEAEGGDLSRSKPFIELPRLSFEAHTRGAHSITAAQLGIEGA